MRRLGPALVVLGLLLVGAVACGGGGRSFCSLAVAQKKVLAGSIDTREADFAALARSLDRLESAAPAEIRADVKTLADAFDEIRVALGRGDFDALDSSLLSRTETATGNVTRYLESRCRIDVPSPRAR